MGDKMSNVISDVEVKLTALATRMSARNRSCSTPVVSGDSDIGPGTRTSPGRAVALH